MDHQILQRLDALERQNRIWKTLAIAVLAIAFALGATSSSTSMEELTAGTVTATSFVMLDDAGLKSAELAHGQLTFFDQSGTSRIRLGTVIPSTTASCGGKTWDPGDGRPTILYFYDAAGNRRSSWDNDANGWSTIAFFDSQGGACANLNVSDDCRSGLNIGNQHRGIGKIWTDEGDEVNMELVDTQDQVRWTTRR